MWTAQVIFENERQTKLIVPYPWVDYANKVVYWPSGKKYISKYISKWEKPAADWRCYQLIETLLEYGTKEEAESMLEFSTTDDEPISLSNFFSF